MPGAICIPSYPGYLGNRGTFFRSTSGTATFRICRWKQWVPRGWEPGRRTRCGTHAGAERARACSGPVRMTGCALVRSARRAGAAATAPALRSRGTYLGTRACNHAPDTGARTVRFLYSRATAQSAAHEVYLLRPACVKGGAREYRNQTTAPTAWPSRATMPAEKLEKRVPEVLFSVKYLDSRGTRGNSGYKSRGGLT